MMKFWQLVSQAQQAQSQIISRLETMHGKMRKNMIVQEKSQQNQFMIYDQQKMFLKVNDNRVPNDPIQYTFQNSQKDALDFQNNYQQNDSLERIEVVERFFTQPKEVEIALNGQDVQNCDFASLIEKIQSQQGRKLTEKGIQKILNALKNKMENEKSIFQTLKPQKSMYSTEQNKLEMKTRRKRDELKKIQKQRPSKGNKQNSNDKVEVNYKGLNRMRRNNQSINTNILKTRRQNKYYAS